MDLLSSTVKLISPTLVAITFLIYIAGWIIYARLLNPLRGIPGPFFATISRAWYARQILKGDLEHTQRAFHAQHGPLMRIAPNEIACADPEAIKLIYNTKDPWQKSDFYTIWNIAKLSKYPDHFSSIDERQHAERRRIVNPVYTLSNVLQSEQYINDCSELFIRRLGEYADGRTVVDLGAWLQMFTFDVVGELYFGQRFGFMDNSCDHESYIESLDTLMPPMTVAAVVPTYARPFVLGSTMFFASARNAISALELIVKAAKSRVAQRVTEDESGGSPRKDLLAQLLEIVRDRGEKIDFKVEHVVQEAHNAMFAGSDTTAIAMRSTLYLLMKDPRVYSQLQAEIDEAVTDGRLGQPVKYSEAVKLPYLNACIKEAMRLHPSIGLTMPRIVPRGGVVISGQFIPAGYRIGVNGAVVHRDKGIFGQDADTFNPSRWFERDATFMDKYMINFGAGSRTCIGKNFNRESSQYTDFIHGINQISLSEIYKLIPQVLMNFRLELTDRDVEWKTNNRFFNKQTGLNVHLKRR